MCWGEQERILESASKDVRRRGETDADRLEVQVVDDAYDADEKKEIHLGEERKLELPDDLYRWLATPRQLLLYKNIGPTASVRWFGTHIVVWQLDLLFSLAIEHKTVPYRTYATTRWFNLK